MKRMWLLLLAVLMLSGCEKKDDAQWYVSERYIEFETGDTNHITYTYDDQWRELGSQTLLNGEYASSVAYTYSEDGTIMTTTTDSAVYDPEVTEVHRTFDEKGNIIQTITYYNGKLHSTAEMTYDEQGREIQRLGTDAQSGITMKVSHTYDDADNVLTYCIDNGFYTSCREYTYDSKGRLASETVFQGDQMTGSITYTYTGNVCKGSWCDGQGKSLRQVVNTYDDYGNLLIEESYDLAGNLQSRYHHVYVSSDGRTSGSIPEGETTK